MATHEARIESTAELWSVPLSEASPTREERRCDFDHTARSHREHAPMVSRSDQILVSLLTVSPELETNDP